MYRHTENEVFYKGLRWYINEVEAQTYDSNIAQIGMNRLFAKGGDAAERRFRQLAHPNLSESDYWYGIAVPDNHITQHELWKKGYLSTSEDFYAGDGTRSRKRMLLAIKNDIARGGMSYEDLVEVNNRLKVKL